MKTKTFAEDEVVDFGIQMSEMLETLETKNIFHGNISPKNIFVTADGKYKIGGFTDFEGKIDDKSYIAPEVFRQEHGDYTTDIYSVGIIMYAMCNGGKIPLKMIPVTEILRVRKDSRQGCYRTVRGRRKAQECYCDCVSAR